MTDAKSATPKPRANSYHPEHIRLTKLTRWRRFVRIVLRGLVRLVVWLLTDVKITGLENLVTTGPLLAVSNHLGDADAIIGLSFSPIEVEVVSKIELRAIPVLGALISAYGVIWIHRGQPDRRAVRVVLQALAEGRIVALAPEGRESMTGALEEGTEGAAYLALKADAPILPITFTGTENKVIYSNLIRLRRSHIHITIGQPFRLPRDDNWRSSVAEGTQVIMQKLAQQLPIAYQGVYKSEHSSSVE